MKVPAKKVVKFKFGNKLSDFMISEKLPKEIQWYP